MFLPYRLMALELKRSSCWKHFLHYQKTICKVESNSLRIKFLENCKRSDLIPRFLKFRIPNNGCFDERSVHDFQKRLLHNELLRAKDNLKLLNDHLNEKRTTIRDAVSLELLPSIIVYTRNVRTELRRKQTTTHNKKLGVLSEEQERPLFSVNNTVVLYQLEKTPPTYVIETLSLGPKNAVLDHFEPKDILAELDGFLRHCRKNDVPDETITDINIKTLNYIKKCKKMKPSRNIHLTKKYLKENNLIAIPFDKGIGICVMKVEKYQEKLDAIINLPQFEKVTKTRKNEKHPVLKEEERIVTTLKTLREQEKIDDKLFYKLKPRGSQPARLYGLAKVHKTTTPLRPVLSMPGSAYHRIALQVAEWLSVVPECQINSSTKIISDTLKTVNLDEDEEMISFDVSSLYTNVPVMEAIEDCTELLYSGDNKLPPVDRDTFVTLAQMASCNVLMSTLDGYYRQVDGLAMGSPPAPHLANGWLSKYDSKIKGDAKIFSRYMDDILQNIKRHLIQQKLNEINNLHPSLKFTVELERDGVIPFLDMKIINLQGKLSSTWYNKPTDTGLIMNYHALAPKRYKRSVVSGFVHRIYRACSTWGHFHESMEKAKQVMESNQYPPNFYEPIIEQTLNNIIQENAKDTTVPVDDKEKTEPEDKISKALLFVQYRGKVTEDFARALHHCNAPCNVVMTLRKLRTVLPSLKPPVEKKLRSGVVYKITCTRCEACYVGQTARHLQTRFREHMNVKSPVGKHLKECNVMIACEDVEILASSARGEDHLLTLEALWINEVGPQLNTKDEYKSRTLTIKW